MRTVSLFLPYPARLSRGLLLLKTFLGWLYVGIPHGLCLLGFGIAAGVVSFLSFWVVLFTGRYPKAFFDLVEGVLRWQWRTNSYLYLLHDEYPPFTLENEGTMGFVVAYPQRLGRLHLLARVLLGWLYVGIPHGLCLSLRLFVQVIVSFLAWWWILLTGKIPASFFEFTLGTLRWQANVAVYLNFLTDEYPPFTGKEELPLGQTVAM